MQTIAHNGAPSGSFGDNKDTDVDAKDTLTVKNPGTITGTYGTLVLIANGTYTLYAEQLEHDGSGPLAQSDSPKRSRIQRPTAAATSASTLSITIFGTDDGVTLNGLSVPGGELTLYERIFLTVPHTTPRS